MFDIALSFDSLFPFLIVCPLALVAGFVDAIAGGGGLISLPAYLIAGIPPHLALGTNKLMTTIGSTVATISYIRAGYVNFLLAACCIPCAFLGSMLGSMLVLYISVIYLRWLLLILLPLTALFLLKKKTFVSGGNPQSRGRIYACAIISSFILGAYNGFYGPGTGLFLILALTSFAGMKLTAANGLTKMITFSSNIAAVVVFVWHGTVLFPLALMAALFSVTGNYLGSSFFSKKGSSGCRVVMLLVIVIFMIRVIYDLM